MVHLVLDLPQRHGHGGGEAWLQAAALHRQRLHWAQGQHLHTIYTLSTHYLHTIYTLSTHYLHNIYTLCAQAAPLLAALLAGPGAGVHAGGRAPPQQPRLRPAEPRTTVMCDDTTLS